MRQNINFRPRVSLSCVLLKSQCFNLWSLNISAGPHPRTSYLVNSSLTLLEWYSGEIRTHTILILSQALYQLSYGDKMRIRLIAGTGITGARTPLEDREPNTLDGHCLQDSPIPFIVQIQFLRTHPPSETWPYPKIDHDPLIHLNRYKCQLASHGDIFP